MNHQLHIGHPMRHLPPLTLKFPVLSFCILPAPSPKTALTSLFSSKSTSWQTSKIILRNQGPFYSFLSHKNPLREIVLLFLILQTRKLQLRKAKPLTQDHTVYKVGCWGSNQSLVRTSHASFSDTDHIYFSHIIK